MGTQKKPMRTQVKIVFELFWNEKERDLFFSVLSVDIGDNHPVDGYLIIEMPDKGSG